MKVLLLSTDSQVFNNGSAVRERIKEYGTLVEELHVIVYTRPGFKEEIFGNISLWPTNNKFRAGYFRHVYRLARGIIKNREDWVISSQDPFETGWVGYKLKRQFNIPLQVQVHTDFMSPYFFGMSWINQFRAMLAKWLLKKADNIRVVSERIRKSITSYIPHLTDKIVVLPILFDALRFQKAVSNNQYPEDFLILTVARLEPEKNLSLAIKTMADVLCQYPDKKIRYIIIGSGGEEKRLNSLIGVLAVKDRIFIKQVDASDLPGWYKRADLFLLTSNYEGYGMVVAESIAAGTPVVMSDVGLAGEVVKNGENGFIFSVGNEEALQAILIKILNKEIDLEKLKIGTKAMANAFSNKSAYLESMRKSWDSLLR